MRVWMQVCVVYTVSVCCQCCCFVHVCIIRVRCLCYLQAIPTMHDTVVRYRLESIMCTTTGHVLVSCPMFQYEKSVEKME